MSYGAVVSVLKLSSAHHPRDLTTICMPVPFTELAGQMFDAFAVSTMIHYSAESVLPSRVCGASRTKCRENSEIKGYRDKERNSV